MGVSLSDCAAVPTEQCIAVGAALLSLRDRWPSASVTEGNTHALGRETFCCCSLFLSLWTEAVSDQGGAFDGFRGANDSRLPRGRRLHLVGGSSALGAQALIVPGPERE